MALLVLFKFSSELDSDSSLISSFISPGNNSVKSLFINSLGSVLVKSLKLLYIFSSPYDISFVSSSSESSTISHLFQSTLKLLYLCADNLFQKTSGSFFKIKVTHRGFIVQLLDSELIVLRSLISTLYSPKLFFPTKFNTPGSILICCSSIFSTFIVIKILSLLCAHNISGLSILR